MVCLASKVDQGLHAKKSLVEDYDLEAEQVLVH